MMVANFAVEEGRTADAQAAIERAWPCAERYGSLGLLAQLRWADMELTLHLDHEDADVLPLFVRHMSVLDYEELGERALKQASKKELTFGVPWIMRQATEEEMRKIRSKAPLPMKILWYATRGGHQRLTKRAPGESLDMPVPVGVA